jgi:hypothetical protein
MPDNPENVGGCDFHCSKQLLIRKLKESYINVEIIFQPQIDDDKSSYMFTSLVQPETQQL